VAERRARPAGVRPAAAVRAGRARTSHARPERGDPCQCRTHRAQRLRLVSQRRLRRGARLHDRLARRRRHAPRHHGARDGHGAAHRAGALRGLRPIGESRARRRLLRHVGAARLVARRPAQRGGPATAWRITRGALDHRPAGQELWRRRDSVWLTTSRAERRPVRAVPVRVARDRRCARLDRCLRHQRSRCPPAPSAHRAGGRGSRSVRPDGATRLVARLGVRRRIARHLSGHCTARSSDAVLPTPTGGGWR
jgi:hypothetical protein